MRASDAGIVEESRSEHAPRRRRRRRKRDASSPRKIGVRVRLVYFSLAALWGCLAGTGAVVIVLRNRDAMPAVDGSTLLSLLAALVVSVAGAAIVAAAYYSASRRLR